MKVRLCLFNTFLVLIVDRGPRLEIEIFDHIRQISFRKSIQSLVGLNILLCTLEFMQMRQRVRVTLKLQSVSSGHHRPLINYVCCLTGKQNRVFASVVWFNPCFHRNAQCKLYYYSLGKKSQVSIGTREGASSVDHYFLPRNL